MAIHTKEQGIESMKFLIEKTGMKESDFFFSDEDDTELGYEIGTPLIHDDDFTKSAYEMKMEWEYAHDPVAQSAEEEYWLEYLDKAMKANDDEF